MSRNTKLLTMVSVIVVLLLIYIFSLFRLKPSSQAIDEQSAQYRVESIDSAVLSPSFLARLRARQVNGELPVKVNPSETHAGETINPFALP